MDAKRLAEIKARADAATEGPWDIRRDEDPHDPSLRTFPDGIGPIDGWDHVTGEPKQVEADAAFIAHARQDVPDLLAEVDGLRKLHVEMVARLRRERPRVREAEFFHAREGAEMLDGLVSLFGAAYERHLEGNDAEALALLRNDAGAEKGEPVTAALTSLLGMALVGLRTAVGTHDADDQVLCNVEAGLRELGLDPDKMAADAVRPE